MSVAIRKVEGVKRVEVSLNEGVAKIELEPGNNVTLNRLSRLVEDNGFTPKQARVLVRGEVVSTNGKLQLNVRGLAQNYALSFTGQSKVSPAQLEAQAGKLLQVEGMIPPPQKDLPASLQVLDFEPAQ